MPRPLKINYRNSASPQTTPSNNSLRNIRERGRINFQIEFIVEVVYPVVKTKGGKPLFKFLLANKKIKIIAISMVGEQILDVLKEGQAYRIKAGGVIAAPKDRKFHSPSTKAFDLWINHLDNIETLDNNNSDLNACRTTIKDLERKLNEVKRRRIAFSIAGVKLTSGHVRRYLGCPTCTCSIREPNSDGSFVCTNSMNNCSNSGKLITRKPYFLITDISVTQNEDKITGIICFDKNAKIIIGRDASSFGHDLEATEEFQRMMSKVLKLEMHAERDGKNEWSIILHNLIVEESEHLYSEWTTDGNHTELTESTPRKPTLIQAKKWFQWYTPYLIRSEPCGLVLIILNLNYDNPKQTRNGSEKDATNLELFLKSIGYEVTIKIDVRSKELYGVIKEFQQKCEQLAVDSCMVFVLSHGNNFEIEMVDGQNMNVWESIVYPFTGLPKMHGKPKLFFFDTCQDFIKNPAKNNFLDPTIIPFCTDMLVTFSTLPGHMSHRNKNNGSQFANHLVQMLNDHSKIVDIRLLMDMIQFSMQGKAKKPQICVTFPILFRPLCLRHYE